MNRWLYGYVGGVALIGCITTAQNIWCLKAADWAAWVQAIGSIAAIVGAFEVGRRQANAARVQAIEMAENDRRQRRESVAAIIHGASAQAKSIAELLSKMPAQTFVLTLILPTHPISETVASLTAIPLHELGSYDAVIQLTSLQAALKLIERAIDQFAKSEDPLGPGVYNECVSIVSAASKMALYHATEACKALGVEDRP